MATNGLRIGQLAGAVGVGVETVRYYERRGLLPAPERGPGGYRVYLPADVTRLRFIRRAQALGFALEEIAELLALREDEATSCAEVARRASAKLADLDRRMSELVAIRSALARLAAACGAPSEPGACALLDHLGEDEGRRHG